MEGRGHLDMSVDALLAKNGHLGWAWDDHRRRRQLTRERTGQFHRHGHAGRANAVELFGHDLGMVSAAGHRLAGLGPAALQVCSAGLIDTLRIAVDLDLIARIGNRHFNRLGREARGPKNVHEGRPLGPRDLHRHTEFFGEQSPHGGLLPLDRHLLRANFVIAPVSRVGVHSEQIQVDGQAHARGKGHLTQAGQQPTVGAVVIGEHQIRSTGLGQRRVQLLKGVDANEVGRLATEHSSCLCEHRATQAVPALAEVDEHQHRIGCIGEHRRPCLSSIDHRGHGREVERDR